MKQDNKIPEVAPRIQRLAPRLPVKRLLLLVHCRTFGSEGLEPLLEEECPYYHHQTTPSCVSGSGGSCCAGFCGTTSDGFVQCSWLPRWTRPGQTVVILAEDVGPQPQRARWN